MNNFVSLVVFNVRDFLVFTAYTLHSFTVVPGAFLLPGKFALQTFQPGRHLHPHTVFFSSRSDEGVLNSKVDANIRSRLPAGINGHRNKHRQVHIIPIRFTVQGGCSKLSILWYLLQPSNFNPSDFYNVHGSVVDDPVGVAVLVKW